MKKLTMIFMLLPAIVKPSDNHKCHIKSNESTLEFQRIVMHYDNRVEVSYVGSNTIDVYCYQSTLLIARFNPLQNKFYKYHGPEKIPSFCKISYFEN